MSSGRRRLPATAGAGRRLLAWAADYAYAARQQIRHVVRRTPVPGEPGGPGGPGGRSPVVLLPGIYETWEFLSPVATALARAGHPVHVVRELGHNARPVLEGARVTAAFLEREDLRDVVLVAHSKGGLIGKHVLLSPAGSRVAGMVAVATPFAGSRLARYTVGRALRSFAPHDPVLLALSAELAVNERITAVYPRFDPHIPEPGHLLGGTNIELPLSGHFRPLGDPTLIALVVREVGRLSGSGQPGTQGSP